MQSERFRAERKKLNLTQEQLSKKLNTSRSNIANWENGQNNPSLDMLFKCSELFGCTVDYLAGYSDNRTESYDENMPIPEYESDDMDILDDLDILYYKTKNILSDSERATVSFVMKNAIEKYEESKKNKEE